MIRRLAVLPLAISIMFPLLVGCGSSSSTSPTSTASGQSGTGGTIRIGVIEVLSGPESYDGERMLEAVKMITEQVNKEGGLLGKQIELKVEDGAGETATSANAAEKLVASDKVQALIGAYASTATAGLLPIVATYQIPLVNCVSQDPKLSEQGKKWFFQGTLLNSTIAKTGVPEFVSLLGIKKAAIVVINSDAELEYSDTYKNYLTQEGVAVTQISFPEGTQDFSSILTKLKNEAPDTVFINMGSNEGVNFLKQVYQSGLKANMVGSDMYQQWADEIPQEIDGMYFAARYVVSDPNRVNQKFVADFKARTGKLPDDSVAGEYDSMLVLFDAIKRAGTMDAEKLRAAVIGTDMEITRGHIEFNAQQRGGFATKIVQFKNGALVLIKTIPFTGV